MLNEYWLYKSNSWNKVRLNWFVDGHEIFWWNKILSLKKIVKWLVDCTIMPSWYWDAENWQCLYWNWMLWTMTEEFRKKFLSRYDLITQSEENRQNKLKQEEITFLEEAKSEWFDVWKTEPNKSSWYYSYIFEVPWGQLFTEDEISMNRCQWCEDDMNELDIEVIEECICSKNIYRETVKKILSLLEKDEKALLIFTSKEFI